MIRAAVALVMFLFLVEGANAQSVAPDGAAQWNGREIQWRTPAEGLAEAKREGKIALVVVQTDWCPVCREYRNVFKDPRIVAASREVAMILVDADKDAKGDGVFAPEAGYVPRTVFVDQNGDVVFKSSDDPKYHYYVDPEDPEKLLSLLQRAAALQPKRVN